MFGEHIQNTTRGFAVVSDQLVLGRGARSGWETCIQIKVLENFCARLRIPIRHFLQACQEILSIAAPAIEH